MLTGDERIPTMECAIETKIISDPNLEFFELLKNNPTLSRDKLLSKSESVAFDGN